MSQRTALYLADRVRFHTGIFDRSLLRDGFLSDRGEADRDILSALNDTIRLSAFTGQFVCEFTLEVTEDTYEYAKDPDMGLIKEVLFQGVPMKRRSLENKNNYQRAWQQTPVQTGTPNEYISDIPDVLWLFPIPDTTDDAGEPSVVILAETVGDDLSEPDDVPARIPSMYHEGLAYGAAVLILSSMGDVSGRIETLTPVWNRYLAKMQEQAQRQDYGAVDQIVPESYRRRQRGL
jgi:hypothetical protein